jgi:hypothetical protein
MIIIYCQEGIVIMSSMASSLDHDGSVRLRISVRKLAQLIETGSLCAADFSCLDHESKNTIKKLFLRFCLDGFRVQQIAKARRLPSMTDSPAP